MMDDNRRLDDELRAGFQAKVDAADFWMKGEFPHYLATCNGKPTEEGFKAYLDERLAAADPQQKERIEAGFICGAILAAFADDSDPTGPMTIMSDTELLQRLGLKPDDE
jgi:hypothetical protein